MSEILFIRHAETDMAGTFCGHSDPELNARGYLQVAQLIESLRTENIGAVYSSDLRRAKTTAMAVAKELEIDCHVRSALREIDFGQWEGLRWEEIEQRDEAYARLWAAEYPHLPAPDGERFCDFERRVLDEVEALPARAEGERIAVVTHAGALRVVLQSLHDCSEKSSWEQTKSYCCIVRHAIHEPSSVRPLEVSS